MVLRPVASFTVGPPKPRRTPRHDRPAMTDPPATSSPPRPTPPSVLPRQLGTWRAAWTCAPDLPAAAHARVRAALAALLDRAPDTVAHQLAHAARETPAAQLREVFRLAWPASTHDVRVNAAAARRLGLAADLAALVGRPEAEVVAVLAEAHGNTRVGNALPMATVAEAAELAHPATERGPDPRRSTGLRRDPWAPTRLVGGRWRLTGEPLIGGFGEAWPALGPSGERCWVKRARGGQVASLARERRHLETLRHPHIITLLDAGGPPQAPWLVVADGGETLHARLVRGPVPLAELWPWLDAAAQALDYAHGAGVMHHDVSPANLVRDAAGHVRLIDFGTTARLVAGVNTVGAPTGRASAAVGFHPGFVAPEIAYERAGRRSSDQFSLAAVLLAGLAGAPQGGVRLRDPRVALSAKQAAVVGKALALSPRDRFVTCGAFVGALRRAGSST